MSSLTNTLIQAGLDPSMAAIYVFLVEAGEQGVPAILEKTGLSRAGVYDALNFLVAQDYIEYRKSGRNAYYKAAHPNKLYALLEARKRETTLLTGEMEQTIQALTGSYSLTQNKPGVRFFEGPEGLRTVLWDSLEKPGKTIYTVGDLEMWIKQCSPLNDEYLAARRAKNITKQAITNDSEFNRAFLAKYDKSLTDTRLITKLPLTFTATIMEIYDDKVSFVTYHNDTTVGIIIQEPRIYAAHQNMFAFMWAMLAPEAKPAIPPFAQ